MKKAIVSLVCLVATATGYSQTFLNEDFNNGIPSSFTIGNGGNTPFNDTWKGVESYKQTPNAVPRKLNGTPFAFCNGDPGGPGSTMDDTLTTSAMNTLNASKLELTFIHYYRV